MTFYATVTVVSPGAGSPSGTVTFKDGPNTLGTVTLSLGKAQWTTSALGVNSHTITATYSGNGNFLTSTGTTTHPVYKASTKLTAYPRSGGQLRAGLQRLHDLTPLAGRSIVFKIGTSVICTATTNSSDMATCSTSILGSGTYTATFAGDSSYYSSSASSTY